MGIGNSTIVALFCSDIVKFGRREIGKIVHCLPDKKYSPGYPGLATARIAPKICQGGPAPDNVLKRVPDFIQFGSLWAEIRTLRTV